MTHTARSPRAERGFSMFIVIMAMLITSMFVAAGFAAANNDLPISGRSKDRKAAYTAAEAGLNFYESHLNQNPDYWTLCDQVPAPNASEVNPVNQWWDGKSPTDPRRWRNLPDSSPAQYTIELLPAGGYYNADSTKRTCKVGDQTSMIDQASGTFRIRVTGRASANSPVKRSIVATFRRDGFLNFLWFTDFEDLDPQAEASQSSRDQHSDDCADKYRADRGTKCDEISFITGDAMRGPMHTNDSFLFCGTAQWGRSASDRIETSSGNPGYYASGTTAACGSKPNITGTFKYGTKAMTMPPTNKTLDDAAAATGDVFIGKTIIRFNADGTMTYTTMDPADKTYTKTTSGTISQPANGVIYVETPAGASCTEVSPRIADYAESNTCGNVYVSGTYSKSMTIGADNDIIIKPTLNGVLLNRSNDANLQRAAGNDSVLGLIANNFVRVAHKCNQSTDTNISTTNEPQIGNVKIQAAILSLQHSFILDNHDCGSPLGSLTVEGVIAQKYRGTVSTHNNGTIQSGYQKDYNYDDRMRYRSPPYFLNPVDAAWTALKLTEQVPAT